jgi:DNA-directed RNA polymerase specialized sigma24 family protein
MILDSAEKFFSSFESTAESLYEAAKHFAAFHENYRSGKLVSIDKTSQTIMEQMQAQTQFTPEDQVDDMRKKREKAIEHFCYIYGGYIARKLKAHWEASRLGDIVEKDNFISLAAEQVVASLIRSIQKNGYKKGQFSHLVHCAIKNKAKDVAEKYATWTKKNLYISFDNAEDIIGGVIDIVDDNGADNFDFDVDEKELDSAGIFQILKQVKTKNSADDYNMFILHRVKKYPLAEIAEKFNISASTASRRINDFAEAALKLFRQYQREMEN